MSGAEPEWVEPIEDPYADVGRLGGDEVAELARGLAELARSGLSLPGGMRALAREVDAPRLRSAFRDLARRVEAGEGLDDAIGDQGTRFPRHLARLVEAGVRTGRLADVLGQFTGYYSVGSDLRRRLWVALAYPTVLITVAAGVFGYISVFLVNDFANIFKDFGVDVPGATRRLFVLARIVRFESWAGPASFLGVLAALALAFRFLLGPADRQRYMTAVPLFGPLWRLTTLAEFAHLLALLIETSVPLPEALPLAAEGVRDADLARSCRDIRLEIEEGRPLAAAVADSRAFPASLGQLLGWADGRKALPEALHMAGEMFEAQARAQGRYAGVVAGIAVVLLVLGFFTFVQFALFFPLISLISKLSG